MWIVHSKTCEHTFSMEGSDTKKKNAKKVPLNPLYFAAWQPSPLLLFSLAPTLMSHVSWPAAVVASRRALLMTALKQQPALKQENDSERERKRMWQTYFLAPQHQQIQSTGNKKERDSKRQRCFSEQSLSVFSSSSAPKHWSQKWCCGLRVLSAVCMGKNVKAEKFDSDFTYWKVFYGC